MLDNILNSSFYNGNKDFSDFGNLRKRPLEVVQYRQVKIVLMILSYRLK
jgi:hypothetical protein